MTSLLVWSSIGHQRGRSAGQPSYEPQPPNDLAGGSLTQPSLPSPCNPGTGTLLPKTEHIYPNQSDRSLSEEGHFPDPLIFLRDASQNIQRIRSAAFLSELSTVVQPVLVSF